MLRIRCELDSRTSRVHLLTWKTIGSFNPRTKTPFMDQTVSSREIIWMMAHPVISLRLVRRIQVLLYDAVELGIVFTAIYDLANLFARSPRFNMILGPTSGFLRAFGGRRRYHDRDDHDEGQLGKQWFTPHTEPQQAGSDLLLGGEFGRVSGKGISRHQRWNIAKMINDPHRQFRAAAYVEDISRVSLVDYCIPSLSYFAKNLVPNTNGTAVAMYDSNVYSGQFSGGTPVHMKLGRACLTISQILRSITHVPKVNASFTETTRASIQLCRLPVACIRYACTANQQGSICRPKSSQTVDKWRRRPREHDEFTQDDTRSRGTVDNYRFSLESGQPEVMPPHMFYLTTDPPLRIIYSSIVRPGMTSSAFFRY